MTTLRQLIQTSPARVNELFAKLVDTSETAVKTREKIFTELKGELELLADLEEQHLFPVLRKHKELKDLVREALNDNKATRKLLTELDHTPKDNEEFASRVAELRRVFQQHVRDEKKELLPAVLKALSDEEAEAVVDRIEAGKAEIEEAKRAEAEERRAEAKREREQAEAEQARIEAAERADANERRAAARREREETERVQQAAEAVVDIAWTAPRTAERAARSVQEVAERSLTQAREALENFWRASRQSAEAVEKTGDRVQAETRDMARRAFSSAEQNIRTTLDYAERLVRARDLQEAARIQAEFVRSQAEAMQTQMREFGSAVQSGISRAAPQTVSEADQAASPKTTRGRREEA